MLRHRETLSEGSYGLVLAHHQAYRVSGTHCAGPDDSYVHRLAPIAPARLALSRNRQVSAPLGTPGRPPSPALSEARPITATRLPKLAPAWVERPPKSPRPRPHQ